MTVGQLLIRLRPTAGGCLEWTGGTNGKGYGYMKLPPALAEQLGLPLNARVHRVVFALVFGADAGDLDLDHTCRNKICCNVWHLVPMEHGAHSLLSNGDRWGHATARPLPPAADAHEPF